MKSKKAIYISAAVLILVIIFGSIAYSAVWTGGYKVPAASPSVEMLERIKSVQKNGGSLEISDSEINSFIQNFMNKSMTRGGITIEGIGVNLINDRMIIKAPVIYKGFEILVSCSAGIALENDKLVLKPLKFKAGKLPLPASLVLGKIANRLPEGIKINKDSIEIDKDIIPFPVKTFTVKESRLLMDIPSPAQLAEANGTQAQQPSGSQVTVTPAPANKSGSTSSKAAVKAPAADPKVEASLKKVSGGLSAVSASVETSDEKAIISRIQSTVNKIIADPNYSYNGDVSYVKSKYKSLSQESKDRVKKAIIGKMNVAEIMKLVYMFGV